jgi:hypothetical protein
MTLDDFPPAPTRPIAEMGLGPEDHWQQEVRTELLLQRNGSFRRGYTQGWWWGCICGAIAATFVSAIAVLGWASWMH